MRKSKISKTQTSRLYKRLAIIFTSVVVVLLGLIIYFSVGKTVITITLQPQDVMAPFTINIGPTDNDGEEENEVTIKTSKLAGYLITSEISNTEEFTIAGESKTAPAQSTGTVTIYNNWSEIQPLPPPRDF